MRPGDETTGEGNWGNGVPGDELEAQPPAFLSRAATGWVRQGYRVRYSDAFLIQLIRRGRPGREALPFIALGLLGFIGAAAALAVALSRRPWHVVTLAIGPDERVLTHQQRAMRPPEV